jgi:hypothetical protein
MIRKLEVRIGEAGTDLARLRLEAYVKSCKKLGIKTALQLNSVKRVYLEALEEVARGVIEQPINDERIGDEVAVLVAVQRVELAAVATGVLGERRAASCRGQKTQCNQSHIPSSVKTILA